MVIHPMIKLNFTAKSEYKWQGRVPGWTRESWRWILQAIKQGVVSRVCGEIKRIYLYFSPQVVFYKASPWDRNSTFLDGFFDHRHENWLHLLITRIFVTDFPSQKFWIYQKHSLLNTSRRKKWNKTVMYKTVLNTHRVVRLWYNHQQWVYVRDTTHFGEVFMKMRQQTAKSATKNDGDFLILICTIASEQKRVRIDIFCICPRTLEVWLNLSFNEHNSKSRAKVCAQWRMSLSTW